MEKNLSQGLKMVIKKGRKQIFDPECEIYTKEKSRRLKKISLLNGKFFILPIDQGLEHGPVDFFANPESANPEFQLEIAMKVGYSAIAMQYGLAKRYWKKIKYKKNIPLVVKINGKTQIPNIAPFSVVNATVEEAVDLGADAIGYTLYVGSSWQNEDFKQFADIRRQADKYDLPVIVWAYPRGERISADGGKDSVAAVDYAVRVAMELGADIVKFNLPKMPKGGFNMDDIFAQYNLMAKFSQKELLQKVVDSAGTMGTLLSGGDLSSKKESLQNVSLAMECGVDGVIFGRNIWQREYSDAVDIASKIKKILLA